MKKAVLGMPWAKETLTRCTNADPAWTLKDLHGHLDSAYLQEEEEEAARAADGHLQDMPANAALPGIFYQGQGIYGRERNPGSRSSAPNGFFKRPSDVDRFGSKRQCWNCGSDNHLIRDCRKPRNMMAIVAKRASKAKSKDELKQVLYEVIVQTEDAIFENENEGAATFWQTNLSDSDGRYSSDSDCDSSINKSPPPDTLYQGLQDIQRRQHANVSFSAVNPEDF
jgi:Zinc knuckle